MSQSDRSMAPEPPVVYEGPFSDLSTTGLLWLINRVVFHPRGFALALKIDGSSGEATGWQLLGDGSEPWWFNAGTEQEKFEAAQALLAPRPQPAPEAAE